MACCFWHPPVCALAHGRRIRVRIRRIRIRLVRLSSVHSGVDVFYACQGKAAPLRRMQLDEVHSGSLPWVTLVWHSATTRLLIRSHILRVASYAHTIRQRLESKTAVACFAVPGRWLPSEGASLNGWWL